MAARAPDRRIGSLELIRRDFDGKDLWQFSRGEQIATREGGMVWSARQHHDWQLESFPAGYYSPENTPNVNSGNTLILTHTDRRQPTVADVMLGDDRLIEVPSTGGSSGSGLAATTSTISSLHLMREPPSGPRSFHKGCSFDWLTSRRRPISDRTIFRTWVKRSRRPRHHQRREATPGDRRARRPDRRQLGPDFSASNERVRFGISSASTRALFRGGRRRNLLGSTTASRAVTCFNRRSHLRCRRILPVRARASSDHPGTLELVWSYTIRASSAHITARSVCRMPHAHHRSRRRRSSGHQRGPSSGILFPLFCRAGPSIECVYRAYRVPYTGFLIEEASEQRVTTAAAR